MATATLPGLAESRSRALDSSRRGSLDERFELTVECLDLALEKLDALCEGAQRELGSGGRVGEVGRREPQAGADAG
ncbi:MAG: hypothetical protein ACR2OB_14660 [Solirubrobacteraceae bacterium]